MVRAILEHHAPGVRAWAFGSRVNGTAKRFSDLDIALKGDGELPLMTLADLRHAFAESDLPMCVDLVDLHSVRPAFRKLIEAERVALTARSSTKGRGVRQAV
ncbi:MAG: nucleotidyltransferase domain-containing protein [Flavobacteriales bacterium]|nr:nucleotidyltransferase domain-containing protein [Flavobacteriales bacterium]